jgi:hypothetical protein
MVLSGSIATVSWVRVLSLAGANFEGRGREEGSDGPALIDAESPLKLTRSWLVTIPPCRYMRLFYGRPDLSSRYIPKRQRSFPETRSERLAALINGRRVIVHAT